MSYYGKYILKTPAEINREEQRVQLQEHTKLMNEQRDKADRKRANYNKFLVESKDFLMVEALHKMLSECFINPLASDLNNVARNCCESFVKEEGTNNILKRCKTTRFLNEFSEILEETHKEIIHGAADNKSEDFEINNSALQGYYDKLRTMNYGPMCNAIIDRVTSAEKDFIEANIKDREKMEEAAEKAAEKIDKIRGRDEETEEKIKEEYTLMYNQEVNNLTNRRRNILESIVKRLGESVIVSESCKDIFVLENGKLNTGKVINTAEVMYTFLEMVNTCRFKEVNNYYIESVLKSIK